MTNPTPTTRKREATDVERANAAPEVIRETRKQIMGLPWSKLDIENVYTFIGHVDRVIAAALARERWEALTEAARLTCWACANYVQYVDGMHQHPHTGEWVNCNAIAINRELIRSNEK